VLASEPLIDLPFITVVAPSHPLAKHKGAIAKKYFEKQTQLVLTDRTTLSEGRTFGVLSPLTWHLADLGAKHAFLSAGLGWGHMPLHMVKKDLDAGTLVKIKIEGIARDVFLSMHVVYRKDTLPGPIGRAFISQLRI